MKKRCVNTSPGIGEEYKGKRVVCRECSENDVIFYPKDDCSSTNIIDKIKNL